MITLDITEADGGYDLLEDGRRIAHYDDRETAELMGDFAASCYHFSLIVPDRTWLPIERRQMSLVAPLWARKLQPRR